MKVVKYALSALVAICLAVVAYLTITFDPRDHAPRIVELVKQKTGRTLQIKGEIGLSFWPDLGVRLGAVSLSERAGDEPFADIQNARLRVRLLPLLSRELIADEIVIQGAHVRLTRFVDGRLNIDDLLNSEGGALQIDIGRVTLERSALTYRDLASGGVYELSAIELETGRISNAQSTPVKLALRARNEPQTFDIATALKGRLTLDAARQRYTLDGAALEVKGRAAGMTELVARATGNFRVSVADRNLDATQVAVALTGALEGQAVEAAIESPAVVLGSGRSQGEAMVVSMRATGPAGTTRVSLKLPRLEYAADTLTANDAAIELELERAGRLFGATIQSPLEIGLAARALRLTRIESGFNASGAGLPRAGITGALTGSASVDLTKQSVQTTLAGLIGESKIKAALTASGFATPIYTFAIDLDQLDLDRYVVADAKQRKTDSVMELAELSTLPATGTLNIGMLKTAGVRARNVRLVVKP